MKALLMREYNQIEYTDVPDVSPCGPEDVIVEVRACGICGSDVAGMTGRTGRRIPPAIMGHESTGVIREIGEKVKNVRVGDRVAVSASQFCGQCDMCLSGHTNLCETHKVLGISCSEYRLDGAYAEFIRVPARTVFLLPDGVSFVEGALLEPLANAVHAATALTGRSFPFSVLVYGCGTIGLMVIQALRAYNCARIIAVDTNSDKLIAAKACGANVVFGAEGEDVVMCVRKETGERGVKLCVECVGVETTMQNAIMCLADGGFLSVVGLLDPQMRLPMQRIVTGEIQIRGSFTYTAADFEESIRLLAENCVHLEDFISDEMALSEGERAFDRLRSGKEKLVKIVLTA